MNLKVFEDRVADEYGAESAEKVVAVTKKAVISEAIRRLSEKLERDGAPGIEDPAKLEESLEVVAFKNCGIRAPTAPQAR